MFDFIIIFTEVNNLGLKMGKRVYNLDIGEDIRKARLEYSHHVFDQDRATQPMQESFVLGNPS